MEFRANLPCKTCISFAICRNNYNFNQPFITDNKIILKCEMLFDYIFYFGGYISRKRYKETKKFFEQGEE